MHKMYLPKVALAHIQPLHSPIYTPLYTMHTPIYELHAPIYIAHAYIQVAHVYIQVAHSYIQAVQSLYTRRTWQVTCNISRLLKMAILRGFKVSMV